MKKDAADPSSDLRVCGDYKQTVNRVAPLDNYPIPTVDEHLASFKGCVTFSKIDLKQAYQQLELDDETKELLTVNTHEVYSNLQDYSLGCIVQQEFFKGKWIEG